MNCITISIVISIFYFQNLSAVPVDKSEPALLIVSFDSFTPEYLKRGKTPNMNKFLSKGISARFLSAVFPTKTFPNHHTISTVSAV